MEAEDESEKISLNLPHHIQRGLCTTRAAYRQGRKLTAVKVDEKCIVYTVNNESQHLLIHRVPAINLSDELQALCEKFGQISKFDKLEVIEPGELFTEIFHVRYTKVVQARRAKRQMDGRSFYGSLLHVCFAPELEALDETRIKLINRRNEIAFLTGRKAKIPNLKMQNTRFVSNSNKRTQITQRQYFLPKRAKLDDQNPGDWSQPSTSSNGLHSTDINLNPNLDANLSGPSGPFDITTSYPSQQVLNLPGQEVKLARDLKLTPRPIVRQRGNAPVNKIIFHNKPTS